MTLYLQRPAAWRNIALALAMTLVVALSGVRPSLAESAGQRSTRNIILGGVAVATAIILYNNYHHKQVAHDTVVGRTPNGGTVYADGRIVYPNGDVLYTSNDGRTPCGYDGYETSCGPYARGYHRQRYAYAEQDHRPAYRHDRQEHGGDSGDDEGDGGD